MKDTEIELLDLLEKQTELESKIILLKNKLLDSGKTLELFSIVNTNTYDFSECNHPDYVAYNKLSNVLADKTKIVDDKLKIIKNYLKNINTSSIYTIENTGKEDSQITIYPPKIINTKKSLRKK